MQIDQNLIFAILGIGSFLLVSTYYFFFKYSGENSSHSLQNAGKKTQNSKWRKKRKTDQNSGINQSSNYKPQTHMLAEEMSLDSILRFLRKSDFSVDQIKSTVNVLLSHFPPDQWEQVLPEIVLNEFQVFRVAEKESEMNKMKMEIKSLRARLENAQDELVFCSKAAKGVEESFRGRISSLESEIERIETNVAKASADHVAVETELRRKLSVAKKAEQEAQSALNRLLGEVSELEGKLKTSEAFNGHEIAGEKDKLISVIQDEITETNRKLVVARNTVETLRRQMEATDGCNLSQLLEKLSLTETKVTQLTTAVVELTNEKQQVETALEEKTKGLASARQIIVKLSEEQSESGIEQMWRDCDLLRVRLAEAEEEMARLRQEQRVIITSNV